MIDVDGEKIRRGLTDLAVGGVPTDRLQEIGKMIDQSPQVPVRKETGSEDEWLNDLPGQFLSIMTKAPSHGVMIRGKLFNATSEYSALQEGLCLLKTSNDSINRYLRDKDDLNLIVVGIDDFSENNFWDIQREQHLIQEKQAILREKQGKYSVVTIGQLQPTHEYLERGRNPCICKISFFIPSSAKEKFRDAVRQDYLLPRKLMMKALDNQIVELGRGESVTDKFAFQTPLKVYLLGDNLRIASGQLIGGFENIPIT